MDKTYELSNKNAVLLRRAIAILSLTVSIAVFAVWLLGSIPIQYVSSNPKQIIDNAFELLNITTKPFWYCASRGLFSIFYIWFLIASLSDFKNILACKKSWWGDENDTHVSRFSITNCVSAANRVFVRFGFLYLISFVIAPFPIPNESKVLFILLLLLNFLLNSLKLFYFKRNIFDSIIPTLGSLVMLALLLMFMYNIYDVNVAYVFSRIVNFFRTLTYFKAFGEGYILESILSVIVIPIFHFLMLYWLAKAYFDSMYYGNYAYDHIESCKKTMRAGIIVTCIIIIVKMVLSKDTQAETFYFMLIQNADIIALCLCLYFSSKSHIMVLQDAPVYDGITNIPEEKKSNEATEEDSKSENA